MYLFSLFFNEILMCSIKIFWSIVEVIFIHRSRAIFSTFISLNLTENSIGINISPLLYKICVFVTNLLQELFGSLRADLHQLRLVSDTRLTSCFGA